ncbi:MAG: N-acyl-D-glutamate amidohydrolase [Myxococcales bacterium]|nr:N-acyl-D-glutamate amidohydrolase [Myxococcales bacterium]MCB9548590.1 N-acyl-D-glutamate amidohydrolase [Myxococcales bacterium]
MTAYILAGGTIFDGTGRPGFPGHVLIEGERVTRVSPTPIPHPTAEVIDVTGQWVMPGFVDNHTHYDGEVLVAPGLGESVRHGVTTVMLGGCSLSFVYADVDDCCDMFTRVEAFPRDVLIPILRAQKTWATPAAWIEHLHGLPLGPNVASFIGHSDIRARVMGIDRSLTPGERPTAPELAQMVGMLEDALDAGLIGISMQHNPWDKMDGRHWSKLLPAAYAKGPERRALTRVVRRRGAHLQGVPNLVNRVAALWYMSQSASWFGLRRKLKTSMVAMMNLKGDPYIRAVISGLSGLFNKVFRADFRMQAFPVPFKVIAEGMDLVIFEEFPTGALARHLARDLPARDATLRDPDYRRRFKKHYHAKLSPKVWQKDFGDTRVLDAPDKSLIGKSFGQFAAERGQHPVDTFLDLVLEQDRAIKWETVIGNQEPADYGKLYNDPNGILGFADSGAHINNLAFYNFPVRVLRYVQASHEAGAPLMPIEKAIWRLTKENADFFNLDAGHLAEGKRADVTVIDPARLTDDVHAYHTAEFLAGHDRLVNRSDEAVRLVLIGGRVAWRDGAFSADFGQRRFGRFLPGDHAPRTPGAPAQPDRS